MKYSGDPQIEDFSKILTNDQIENSKSEIERRMRNYPYIGENHSENHTDIEDDIDFRLSYVKNNETEKKDQTKQVPIVKLLENRNRHIKNLQNYWESKVGTIDNQIALVALEILGVLVTSAMASSIR